MSARSSSARVAVVDDEQERVEPEPAVAADAPLSPAARAALRSVLKKMLAHLDESEDRSAGRPPLIPRDDPDFLLVVTMRGNQRQQAAERLVERLFVEDGVKVDPESVFSAARIERKKLREQEQAAAPDATAARHPAAKSSRR